MGSAVSQRDGHSWPFSTPPPPPPPSLLLLHLILQPSPLSFFLPSPPSPFDSLLLLSSPACSLPPWSFGQPTSGGRSPASLFSSFKLLGLQLQPSATLQVF